MRSYQCKVSVGHGITDFMIKQLKENWHYGAAIMATIYNIWMTVYAFEKYEPHLKSLSFLFFGAAIVSGSTLFFSRSMDQSAKEFKQLSEGTK